MKIYVADDSAMERALLSAVLSRIDTVEFKIFDNGLDLWFECLQISPDLIIVDLMLTSLSGLDFLTLFRAHEGWNQYPPVLVVSSLSPSEMKSVVIAAGAQEYFHKPLHPGEFEASVRKYVFSQSRASAL